MGSIDSVKAHWNTDSPISVYAKRIALQVLGDSKEKTNTMEDYLKEMREKHANAYAPWTEEEDGMLEIECKIGNPIGDIAKLLGRTEGAIRSRVEKLNLELRNVKKAFSSEVFGRSFTQDSDLFCSISKIQRLLCGRKRDVRSRKVVLDSAGEFKTTG